VPSCLLRDEGLAEGRTERYTEYKSLSCFTKRGSTTVVEGP
jgi:hypothetical protein